MKKNLSALALVIGLSVPFAAKMQSQVKIGDEVLPAPGAVLDLKKTQATSYEGGLLLPHVDILDMEYIPAVFTDAPDMPGYDPVIGVDTISALQGMIVYNSNVETGRGVYFWDGEKWKPAGKIEAEECVGCEETALITTFVNVMYDFQHQTLETANTGTATKYQWQVSTDNFASDISHLSGNGANTANYTIPAGFINDYDVDSLYFRCLMTRSGVRITTPSLNMFFIRTNTAGYEGIGTDNPYLTIQNGGGGTFKLSLLNLGQSANREDENSPTYTVNNDAGDLGDFYQWGRVADGHETVTWYKHKIGSPIPGSTGYNRNWITYSETIPHDAAIAVDGNGQIMSNTPHHGKFITTPSSPYDWSTSATADNRWGNGSAKDTRTSDIQPDEWTYQDNNPCPAGWGVPTRWNWWDMFQGDGDNLPDYIYSYANVPATVNTWRWRVNDTVNKVYGGLIITNANGEKVFLPGAGSRGSYEGNLSNVSEYWTCTNEITGATAQPNILRLNAAQVGFVGSEEADGLPVRCVQEVPAP